MKAHGQALALGFLDISVYDIKAAALNKLVESEDGPWRDLGIETIKIMCQKWPESWRVSEFPDFVDERDTLYKIFIGLWRKRRWTGRSDGRKQARESECECEETGKKVSQRSQGGRREIRCDWGAGRAGGGSKCGMLGRDS